MAASLANLFPFYGNPWHDDNQKVSNSLSDWRRVSSGGGGRI